MKRREGWLDSGDVPFGKVDRHPDRIGSALASARRRAEVCSPAKRAVDLVAGSVGCVLCLALLPIIGPAIWLDTGSPIFYRQQRVGRADRRFQIVKFRTMRRDAERDGPQWAADDDPRVTRVGRWLRRSRLDELPQFWLVLKGAMSLVGPRPERPEYVSMLERVIPGYRERHRVPVGLTGWAQINCPYGSSVEDAAAKLKYDLYYVEHASVLFDLWIAIRTIKTIITCQGR